MHRPSKKLKYNCKYIMWNIQEEWWKKTLNLARISKVLRLHRYLDCLGESLSLSFSEHFHLLIWLKRKKKKLRDENQNCLYYVFRLFEPKGGKSTSTGTSSQASWESNHILILLYIPKAANTDSTWQLFTHRVKQWWLSKLLLFLF